MRVYRYLLILFMVLSSFPIHSENNTEPPKKAVEKTGPKYFTDTPEDKPVYDESSFWGELINMFITLGFIIVILIALAWIMRRMQSSRIQYANESSVIKLIDHRSLSTKSAVYLLHIEGHAVVVAESPSGMAKLADFPIDAEGSEGSSIRKNSRFDSFMDGNKS